MHRHQLQMTQAQYASSLGVTQAYVSLLERGRRPLTPALQQRLAELYAADPTRLPLTLSAKELSDDTLANTLGRLDYPGFAHLKAALPLNPAALLLEALRKSNLDPRVTEALPWLLSHFTNLDRNWLVATAKQHNFQNRLGFLAALANEVRPRPHLKALLADLEPARLAAEQTLMNEDMPPPLRKWMREGRHPLAKHWNLLTRLNPESVSRWLRSQKAAHAN